MGGLFTRKRVVSRITEQDKAVLQLKQQRDKLKQYQKKLQIDLEKERELAKQLLQDGKKEKAKLLLRKKRFQENIVAKADTQLENIERMVHDIEFAQIEVQVIEGLKSGNESLAKMHQLLTVENVEMILDDTQQGIEYQKEIDELLSGKLTDEDEDDVLAELDTIIKDTLPDVPQEEKVEKDIKLPDVPTDRIKDKVQDAEMPTALLAA